MAAGNDNANSCNYSPAGAEKAVTVGASTLTDSRAYFSNFGKCNDIFAPGLNIKSTWIGSKHAVNTISGTSMASPHIAGLLAYFVSLQPSKDSDYGIAEISPEKLKKNLISIGTSGALSDVPDDTTNILAWNGGGSSNYSHIVDQGGYTVTSSPKEHATPKPSVPGLAGLEKDFELMSKKILTDTEHLFETAEAISERVEEFVSDKLESLFSGEENVYE